ncbi:MAG: lytic transglycosylase domain-containing protein [Silvanigrellales bacterium]|nr:lytic transglycosylase domain-containing protein [Silvanigrellales bacterium]
MRGIRFGTCTRSFVCPSGLLGLGSLCLLASLFFESSSALANSVVARSKVVSSAMGAYESLRMVKGALSASGDMDAQKVRRLAGQAFVAQSTVLGDVDDLLVQKNHRGARKRLQSLPLKATLKELRAVRYLLEARVCVAEGDDPCVVALLNEADGVLEPAEFSEERAFLAFSAAVRAGLFRTAFELYERQRQAFEREFLPGEVERAEVALARWMFDFDAPRARRILRRVGRNFPSVEAARDAAYAYAENSCDLESASDEFFGNAVDSEEFARTILRRLGPLDDVRALAFALADVPDTNELRRKKPDERTLEDRAQLLNKAEFLLGVRESRKAAEITQYLSTSRSFGKGFEADRLLFLSARGLNAVDKPVEAAKTYARVFQSFPSSTFARTARQRWVLSLHYAQRFKQVAAETRKAAGRSTRSSDARWRMMWAEYLSGDSKAFAGEHAASARVVQRARAEYWRARDLERQGRGTEARAIFTWLSENASDSEYGILSRWRVALVDDKSSTGSVQLAAKGQIGLSGGFSSDVKEGATPGVAGLRVLVDAGLQEFARAGVANALRKERKQEDILELARVSFHAQDFKSASLFPRRSFRLLQSIPQQIGELKSTLQESRELWQLSFPLAYGAVVDAVARELKMDPFLMLGVMRAESNYDTHAVSWVGARGLMQIMPYTGHRIAKLLGEEKFDAADLNVPSVAIAYGGWYLKRLLTYYKNNLVLAVAAYNAGPEAIDRWLAQSKNWDLDEFVENIPYDQTRNYVSKVLVNMDMYHRLYSPGGAGLSLAESAKLPEPMKNMEMF